MIELLSSDLLILVAVALGIFLGELFRRRNRVLSGLILSAILLIILLGLKCLIDFPSGLPLFCMLSFTLSAGAAAAWPKKFSERED